MAYTAFQPDPDYDDPEDYGYGYFVDDSGERRYGYDPELAQLLPRAPDLRLAANDGNADTGTARDFPSGPGASSNGSQAQAQAQAQERPQVAAQGQAAPAQASGVSQPGGDPFDAELERLSRENGLNPAAIRQVIRRESGGKANAVNNTPGRDGSAPTRATGLIQFLPSVAKSLGTSTEELQQMSETEQLPYVMAYLKRSGVNESTPAEDYYVAVSAPAALGKSDDSVVYRAGSKGYEAGNNRQWDLDRNGETTRDELKRWGAGERAQAPEEYGPPVPPMAGRGDVNPPLAGEPQPGAQGYDIDQQRRQQLAQQNAPAVSPVPPQIPGMAPGQVRVTGVPKTNQEVAAERARLEQARKDQVQQLDNAAKARTEARSNTVAKIVGTEEAIQANTVMRQQRAAIAQDQAKTEIDKVVRRKIDDVDPRRMIKKMSTGQMVLGAFAMMLSGAGAAVSGGGPNLAMQVFQKAIDDDIDAQKENIRQKRIDKDNDLQRWKELLRDEKSAEIAARAEQTQSIRNVLKAQDLTIESADIQASRDTAVAALDAQYEQHMQQLYDIERNRLVTEYKAPVAPMTGPMPVGKNDPAVHNPKLRARLAAEAQANLEPEKLNQMVGDYTEDMTNSEKRDRLTRQLIEKYGAQLEEVPVEGPNGQLLRDDSGNLITQTRLKRDDNGEVIGNFGSAATGPWWNVTDIDTPFSAVGQAIGYKAFGKDTRDRELESSWNDLKLAGRMAWKTEPASAVSQKFESIEVPTRDADVATYLERILQENDAIRRSIQSGTLPQIRAYKAMQDLPTSVRYVDRRVGGS